MARGPDVQYDAEDVVDRRELAAARANDDYVPWEEVKAALGLECADTPMGLRTTTDEGGTGHGRN